MLGGGLSEMDRQDRSNGLDRVLGSFDGGQQRIVILCKNVSSSQLRGCCFMDGPCAQRPGLQQAKPLEAAGPPAACHSFQHQALQHNIEEALASNFPKPIQVLIHPKPPRHLNDISATSCIQTRIASQLRYHTLADSDARRRTPSRALRPGSSRRRRQRRWLLWRGAGLSAGAHANGADTAMEEAGDEDADEDGDADMMDGLDSSATPAANDDDDQRSRSRNCSWVAFATCAVAGLTLTPRPRG